MLFKLISPFYHFNVATRKFEIIFVVHIVILLNGPGESFELTFTK